MHGRGDLAEVIRRAQAFQAAGADMILTPGIANPEDIASLCRSVDIPVAMIVGLADSLRRRWRSLVVLAWRRVIVGSGFARVAMTGVLAAAREAAGQGTFGFYQGLDAVWGVE